MLSSASPWEQFKETLIDKLMFGQRPNPELIAILTVYFVQGILGLSRLAVSFFLKDELALSPAEVAALVGIAALPWVTKPLFGFLSDGVPLFNYRRRPYLMLSGIVGTLAWLALATVVHTTWAVTLALLATSVSVAISDVIADSIVVERIRGQSLGEAGSLQSLTWSTVALGGLITAYLSGWLLDATSPQTIFGITAGFPLLVMGVAMLIAEEPVSERPQHQTHRVHNQFKTLWGTVRQKSILLPTVFIFLWQATPTSDSALFFFSTNELGFEPEFLGRVQLVSSLASLIGIGLYQRFFKAVPFRVILGWTTVLAAALGMTTLLLVTHTNRAIGIDDYWFTLGDSLLLKAMGQIAFMPVLVLSARLCPEGVEATLFALLMSVWNLAGLLSHELGAALTSWLQVTETNFENLWLLVMLTNLSTLLPLPFLGWLPGKEG
ncbi:MAG: folate/biopterin family MFS transporter [Spirulina sp. SIO3F2]|nr:folate/biopterin family MFS transporter [Spirulina sp. SIO3F2]